MTRTRGLLSHLLHSCTQSHWAKVVAGMGAGVAVAFILTPVELVKCRLQVSSHSQRAVPLVRVKAKFTVKNSVYCRRRLLTYGVFYCDFGFDSQEWRRS